MNGRNGFRAAQLGVDEDVKKDLSTDRDKAIAARARQRAIGRELRRMFDDVVQEDVPDDFLELLQKIDEADEKKKDDQR